MSERVVIIGGGLAGLSAARELASAHDVSVLEADQLANGATGHASGLVTVVADWADRPEAARFSIDSFRSFDGRGQFEFHERPFAQLRTTPDLDGLHEEAAGFRAHGFDVRVLAPAELNDEYPGDFDLSGHAGAMVFEDAGWVDPYTYAITLADVAAEAGADIRTGVEVQRIRRSNGEVTGVETGGESIDADSVVVAAGWRTPELAGIDLPVRPFRYQTANLSVDVDVDGYPIAWDQDSRLYWRPERNGELHVGGGAYYVTEPGSVRTGTTEGFQRLLATTVPERLGAIRGARIVGDGTCPTGDSATPDHLPIIDTPDQGPEGLVLATGLHGFGIMAGPAIGRAVRARVTGGDAPFPLEPFRADRFEQDPSWEFPYISRSAAETGP